MDKLKKPELLMPASSLEVLKVAVMYGADAVYFGGELFSLRAAAKNFTYEDIKEGLDKVKEDLDENYRFMLNKYFQRFFHPFVCVLLAIMGCLLGFSKPREQRLIGFTIAIGCIFLYYITLPFFDLLAEKNVLPPLVTAATPPIAFLLAIIAFYKSKDL